MIPRKDGENLNLKLDHFSAAECRCYLPPTLGTTCHEAPPSAAPEANETKSYRDVLTTGSTSSFSPPTNPSNPGGVHMTLVENFFGSPSLDCDEGFTKVVKDKRNKSGYLPSSGIRKSRPGMFRLRNSSCLCLMPKKPKLESLFISRLGPDISASGAHSVLHGYLNLPSLTCTKLRTIYNSYSSFHMSVMEDNFPL
jgi:hypothetical protein